MQDKIFINCLLATAYSELSPFLSNKNLNKMMLEIIVLKFHIKFYKAL